jgi:hypothetical protein
MREVSLSIVTNPDEMRAVSSFSLKLYIGETDFKPDPYLDSK